VVARNTSQKSRTKKLPETSTESGWLEDKQILRLAQYEGTPGARSAHPVPKHPKHALITHPALGFCLRQAYIGKNQEHRLLCLDYPELSLCTMPSFLKYLLMAALLLPWVSTAWSACRQHDITPPSKVRIHGDAVMIVVHESSTYDPRHASKRGVDDAVKFAKLNRIPVIYLQDDSPEAFYSMDDCNPDYWVHSAGGEISFDVTAGHVFIVGGHLELCMSTALHDIIEQWAKRAPRNYQITYLMDAIYSNGKLIEQSAPYYKDFERFMSIVTYGRPGGEQWPKLSLLETMGIIRSKELEINYAAQALPNWDRTFPRHYRVEVQVNQSPKKILRPADGFNPPTVLFHFVDSADALAEEAQIPLQGRSAGRTQGRGQVQQPARVR